MTAERLDRARRVLDVETAGLAAVRNRLDASFARAVDLLLACRGKVVVTGVGKSGIVCRKIAATFSSTGTPAVFLHAGEGGHGDLGTLVRGDVLLAVSKDGESAEVLSVLPVARRLGIPLIAMCAGTASTLARGAEVVLDVSVPEEACPLGLAPTSSTTAMMALGDALAITLLEERGFSAEDFALLHPGGTLGRRLLRVEDLMHRGAELPLVRMDAPLKETLLEITSKRLGVTGVVDGAGELVGMITDGDLRRALEHAPDLRALTARDLMTLYRREPGGSTAPKTIAGGALAAEAVGGHISASPTWRLIGPRAARGRSPRARAGAAAAPRAAGRRPGASAPRRV